MNRQVVHEQETIKKCERILNLFDDLLPRPYCVQPMRKSSESGKGSIDDSAISFKPRRKSPRGTTTMFFGGNRRKVNKEDSTSLMSKSSNLSKLSKQSKQSKQHLNQSKQSSKKSSRNDSFVSPYNRQTRLDRIMRLKVAPQVKQTPQRSISSSRFRLDTSFSSVATSRNKQNQPLSNKPTRLERIMQLKVPKPSVESSMTHYKPYQAERATTPAKKDLCSNTVVELRECRRLQQKQNRQQQREERLWKNFEREREKSFVERSKSKEKEYVQGRRIEKKVESMVSRQIQRLAASRQKQLRRKKIFSNSLFPP